MKRTKRMVLTGVTLAALGGALVTSTAPVHASTADVSSVAQQLPSPGRSATPYWWVAAGAALLGGAAGGAAGGALGTPGGALAGAAAGGVGGFVGYAVSSLFGVASPAAHFVSPAMHALD